MCVAVTTRRRRCSCAAPSTRTPLHDLSGNVGTLWSSRARTTEWTSMSRFTPRYTWIHAQHRHTARCAVATCFLCLFRKWLFFSPQRTFFFALSLKTEVTLNLSPAFILLTTTISVRTVCFFLFEPSWSSMELTQERRGHMKWSDCSQNLFSSSNCSEALTLAGVADLSSCECL